MKEPTTRISATIEYRLQQKIMTLAIKENRSFSQQVETLLKKALPKKNNK